MTHKHTLWQHQVHAIEKSILDRSFHLPEADLWIRRFNGKHWLSAPLLGVAEFIPVIKLSGYSTTHQLLVVDFWDAQEQYYATFIPHSDGKLYFTGHTNNAHLGESFEALLPSAMISAKVEWTGGEQWMEAGNLERLHTAIIQCMRSKRGLEAWCQELGWFKAKSTDAISFNFKQQLPEPRQPLSISTVDPIEAKLQQLYANARGTINHIHAHFEVDYPLYKANRDKLLSELKQLLQNDWNY